MKDRHNEEKISLPEVLAQLATIHFAEVLQLDTDMPAPPEQFIPEKLDQKDLQPNGRLLSGSDIALLEWYCEHYDDDDDELKTILVSKFVAYLQIIYSGIAENELIESATSAALKCKSLEAIRENIRKELETAREKLVIARNEETIKTVRYLEKEFKLADIKWIKSLNAIESLAGSIPESQSDVSEAVQSAAVIAADKIIATHILFKQYTRNTKTDLHSLPGLHHVKFSVAHLGDHLLVAIYKGKKHPWHGEEKMSERDKTGLLLGFGAFAKGKIAQVLESGEIVLDKVYKIKRNYTSEEIIDKASQEMEILTEFGIAIGSCPRYDSINALYESFMKFLGVDLLSFMQEKMIQKNAPTVKECFGIIFGAINAVNEIHKKGYVHRDIKADNLIINPLTGVVKAADLADAIKADTTNNKISGTPAYRAPESHAYYKYTKAMDVYSLGRTLAYIFGMATFDEHDNFKLFDKKTSPYIKNSFSLRNISIESRESLYDLFVQMMDPIPENRIGLDDALAWLRMVPEFMEFISVSAPEEKKEEIVSGKSMFSESGKVSEEKSNEIIAKNINKR